MFWETTPIMYDILFWQYENFLDELFEDFLRIFLIVFLEEFHTESYKKSLELFVKKNSCFKENLSNNFGGKSIKLVEASLEKLLVEFSQLNQIEIMDKIILEIVGRITGFSWNIATSISGVGFLEISWMIKLFLNH